jgi:hypothetical protein
VGGHHGVEQQRPISMRVTAHAARGVDESLNFS